MKIVSEMSLADFDAWSGGYDHLNTLLTKCTRKELNEVEQFIIDALDPEDEGITDTRLNDFLWFEADILANALGYDDWDAFENGEEDEDDDEEDSEENDVDDEENAE